MEYKKIDSTSVKGMAEGELTKALKDNDLAFDEVKQKLEASETDRKNLEAEVEKLKKNQKDPEPEKTGEELVKELF